MYSIKLGVVFCASLIAESTAFLANSEPSVSTIMFVKIRLSIPDFLLSSRFLYYIYAMFC